MRPPDGFTLLEATVALAIVSLIALSALGAVAPQTEAAHRARAALVAAALAYDRMEAVRLLPDIEVYRLPDSLAAGRFPPPFDRYGWSARTDPSATFPGLIAVRVDVTWEEGTYGLESRVYVRPSIATPDEP